MECKTKVMKSIKYVPFSGVDEDPEACASHTHFFDLLSSTAKIA
jgi:hypothetical protein